MAQLRNKFKTTIERRNIGQDRHDRRVRNGETCARLTKWVVELRGAWDCLQQILEHFSSRDGEGCRGIHVEMVGRQVMLTADRFNGLADVAVVRERAIRLLHVMNGILKIRVPSHPNDEVHVGVIYLDRADDIRPSVSRSEPNASPPVNAGVPMTSRLWRLAQENQDVEAALSLYGSPGSPWSRLYGVYKILEPDLGAIGGLEEQQFVDQRRTSFLWAVQNYAGVEDLAQQMSEGETQTARFMSLTKARVYIHRLLEQWVVLKSRHLESHPIAVP